MKSNIIGKAIAVAALLGTSAVLSISPALAQSASTTNSASAAVSVSQHAPMKLRRRVPGAVESENWSGYAITGSKFTFAKGSWHVPEVQCNLTPNTQSAFWVGIDGYSNDTVEQTGTASNCNGTTPVYFAWYEFYPAGSVVLSNFPVQAGDVIGASVTYNGNGSFTVGIHNHNTGQEFSKTVTVSGAQRASVEWIAEAPCCTKGGGFLPLADFDVANYGYDYTSDSGTNYASNGGTAEPIVSFGSDVQAITMVSNTGVTEAIPSGLTADGTSFRVWWEAE
jgi:hypothetical protein